MKDLGLSPGGLEVSFEGSVGIHFQAVLSKAFVLVLQVVWVVSCLFFWGCWVVPCLFFGLFLV